MPRKDLTIKKLELSWNDLARQSCIVLACCALLLAIVEWSARMVIGNVLAEYPPQKSIYRTSEFDVAASINVFGFRGIERQIARGQIVTIGDSFTFGWGVNDQNTWQAALASKLQSRGMVFSVYNLGRPNAGLDEYLSIARTYIPTLRPRLVIIAILQGDDPAQLLERVDTSGPPTSLYQSLKSRAKDALPGFLGAAKALQNSLKGWKAHPGSIEVSEAVVTETWNEDLARLISVEKVKIPEDIARMVRSGNLPPRILGQAARQPRRYVSPYEPGAIDRVEHRMREILGQIASMSKLHGASVVLLSIPDSPYFDTARNKLLSRMGFELPTPGSCAMDDLVERLARSLGVGFMTLTNEFRRRPDRDDLWFRYDGHLSVKGNGVVADYLDSRVAGMMRGDFSRPTEVPYFGEPCSVTP